MNDTKLSTYQTSLLTKKVIDLTNDNNDNINDNINKMLSKYMV